MYTPAFEKVTINRFKGLYLRGLADECPLDHSPECLNVNLSKLGEVSSRFGTSISFALNHLVVREFAASINNNLTLLTCDGNGNIYAGTSSTPLLTVSDMIDFAACNMFNKTFIAPITSTNSSSLYVWDGTNDPRKAAGYKPTLGSMAASNSGSGHVGPGVYKIYVSFITNTGFTTPPAGPVSVTADGTHSISVTNIPTGGAEIVGRQILITQGDLEEAFFIAAGLINDNTTTSCTLNFYDTDLVVSADYLFDLLEEIPTGFLYSGLQKYHGRLIVWGNTATQTSLDQALLSNVDDAESFNSVTGFVQLPSEQDGNVLAGCFTLQDTLYFTKVVGIFGTQDNGLEPQSWTIYPVDGVVGAGHFGIGTVTLTQTPLTTDNIALLTHLGGIHVFNGTVVEPPLTWKIQDLWNAAFKYGNIPNATIAVDPFNQIIYVLFPVQNSSFPNTLLVGFYGEGLDAMNIKWTRYCFPNVVTAIGLLNIEDTDGTLDWGYYLRIAETDGNIYKLHFGYISDSGTALQSHYRPGFASISNGGLDVFTGARFRAVGPGTLNLKLFTEDLVISKVPPPLSLSTNPGRDYLRQFNLTNEKIGIQFGTGGISDSFKVNRIDIFGKNLFPSRPQNGSGG